MQLLGHALSAQRPMRLHMCSYWRKAGCQFVWVSGCAVSHPCLFEAPRACCPSVKVRHVQQSSQTPPKRAASSAQGAPAPSAPPLPAAAMAEQRAPASWEALPVAYPAIYRPGQGQGEHAGAQAQVPPPTCD